MPRPSRRRLVVLSIVLLVAWTTSTLRDVVFAPGPWEVDGLQAVSGGLHVTPPLAAPDGAPRLTAVTWNLRSGLGPDGDFARPRERVETALRDIARSIAAAAPDGAPVDVVGLNEVDFGSSRSGRFDQAAFLADELQRLTGERYLVVRGETWRRDWPDRVRFGNALLSRHPVAHATVCPLDDDHVCADVGPAPPGLPPLRLDGWLARTVSEPRGVIRATLAHPAGEIDVLVTHLEPFVRREREAQALHLQRRWVRADRPTVLMGDMNSAPPHRSTAELAADVVQDVAGGLREVADRTWQAFTAAGLLHDALLLVQPHRSWATFPAHAPRKALDWVLASEHLLPQHADLLDGLHSDHLGVAVLFALTSTGGPDG